MVVVNVLLLIRLLLVLLNFIYNLDMNYVDPSEIAQKVITGIYPGVTTVELDNLAAETAAYLTTKHPDYAILAARIAISNLQKETTKQFSVVVEALYNYVNPKTGKHQPKVSEEFYKTVMEHSDRLNSAIIYDRDYNYNYFGFKTLERSYLMKIDDPDCWTSQHMVMRVSLGIHGQDIDSAIESYNMMSEKFFTHGSPTLFHAGTGSSTTFQLFPFWPCLTIQLRIYETLKTCALISKCAGGIGLNVHNIRAAGTYIAGTNGQSNGLVPMLRVYNNTARYVDQGGNKRPGAFAVYLEPWHADIFDFLDLKKNTGKEENRARDLFYALWINDLFMSCWSWRGLVPFLSSWMPGLIGCLGSWIRSPYEKCEKSGKARRVVPAQKLWSAILESQVEWEPLHALQGRL